MRHWGILRVDTVVYPSGFVVHKHYTPTGHLDTLYNGISHTVLWTTESKNAFGQVTRYHTGDGVATTRSYDPLTGRLTGIVSWIGNDTLQNLSYVFDKNANLASRKDNKKNLEETFTYDDMNRLTGVTLKRPSGQDLHCTMTYDALGRMTSREAVTASNGIPQVTSVFSQPVFDATKVHALASATTAEGVFPSASQTVTYTGFDKVNLVKQGKDSLCYAYGYDRQRILMEEHFDNTLRTKRYVGNCEYVTETEGNMTVEYSNTYLTGPYGVFAVVQRSGGFTETYYVLKDNLGSWTAITNETGVLKRELSYDAWGNLRNPDSWATYTVADLFDKPVFNRGFTGHEHLYNFGLINMNGRMYDPMMSSFLSADRFVQNPTTAQGFNRYAYCLYNPLRYVDPTGWLSGGGGGSGYKPGVPYYTNGMITINLPEVTIIADNPSLSNIYEYEEYEYTPNITSGGFDNGWGNTSSWSSDRRLRGSGGGNGNHGGGIQNSLIGSEIQKIVINYVAQYELDNIALGTIIASFAGSEFNKKMFWNYWNGIGDYELSSSEFEDIVSLSIQTKEPYLSEWNGNPAFAAHVTLYGTSYANSIGTTTLYYDLNGNAIGIHEPYDFNLFPIRDSKSAQIKTTLVWAASKYNIHNKDFYINYNYHP